jgi:hypothetical protein
MRYKSAQTTFIAISALALTGCRDDVRSPLSVNQPVLAVNAEQFSEPNADLAAAVRFDLDLKVGGSLKPGEPIHLLIRGRALYQTNQAEVMLVLPEVAAAEQSSWRRVVVPLGRRARPHLDVVRTFRAGEEFHERSDISIPVAGYYHIYAFVRQLSSDRESDPPGLIADQAGRDLWLWVDEHGGTVTETFDTTLFVGSRWQTAGPRPGSKKDGVYYPECSLDPSDPILLQSTCTPDFPGTGGVSTPVPATENVAVTYDDQSSGVVTRPLVNAVVRWTVTSSATGSVVITGNGFSDASGRIGVIDCQGNVGERNLSVTAYTENHDVWVTGLNGNTTAGTWSGPCGGAVTLQANAYMSHLFMNLTKTFTRHREVFATNLLDVIHAGLYSDGRTYYDYRTSDGELHISNDRAMIFGDYGAFVAAHEYGHKFQDRYWGGLMRYYSAACPTNHPVESRTNFGCAFGEAFADWYAVVVRGTDTGRWVSDMETNYYYVNCRDGISPTGATITCTDDGSVVEGAIGAFLYDLTDPAFNESFDPFQFTATSLVETLRYCRVTLDNGQSIAYDGVDHFIYCIEQRSPYRVSINGTSVGLFDMRTQWPRSATSGSLYSQTDQMRRLWLVDLYSRRQSVGSNPRLDATPAPTSPAPTDPGDPGTGCGGMTAC